MCLPHDLRGTLVTACKLYKTKKCTKQHHKKALTLQQVRHKVTAEPMQYKTAVQSLDVTGHNASKGGLLLRWCAHILVPAVVCCWLAGVCWADHDLQETRVHLHVNGHVRDHLPIKLQVGAVVPRGKDHGTHLHITRWQEEIVA